MRSQNPMHQGFLALSAGSGITRCYAPWSGRGRTGSSASTRTAGDGTRPIILKPLFRTLARVPSRKHPTHSARPRVGHADSLAVKSPTRPGQEFPYMTSAKPRHAYVRLRILHLGPTKAIDQGRSLHPRSRRIDSDERPDRLSLQ